MYVSRTNSEFTEVRNRFYSALHELETLLTKQAVAVAIGGLQEDQQALAQCVTLLVQVEANAAPLMALLDRLTAEDIPQEDNYLFTIHNRMGMEGGC